MPKLLTRWGKALDRNNPLPEYPRPQFARADWMNLNGVWEYAITPQGDQAQAWGEIVVPFSPESQLSGVERILRPGETLHYRREFTLPEDFIKHTMLLHFGAVDHACKVWLNDKLAGSHTGGFTPFTLDITALIRAGTNNIRIEVTDPTDTSYISRGKQSLKPGGIWYTPQSGIWQTVWLEPLPEEYIASVRMEPDIDAGVLKCLPLSDCAAIFDGERYELPGGVTSKIPVPEARLWRPEDPYLYGIAFECGEDRVESYFGMRKFSLGKDEQGLPRLMLNNEVYFHKGLLDQGYWPDGLLTAPSDEAFVYDINEMKALGFNMLRKHIKIEPLRWYYHCDREGMLVWQDMINGGRSYQFSIIGVLPFLGKKVTDGPEHYKNFCRQDEEGRAQFYEELGCMLDHLQNCVSVAMWVPFNEGWGQFDANKAVDFIRARDTSRTIDHASGWHDQGGGGCNSIHVYFKRVRMPKADHRAIVLSEFGGYSHSVKDHVWSEKEFGYRKFATLEQLRAAYGKLIAKQVEPYIPAGLSASVYTQVSDVEEEINGILTYDREVCKFL